MTLHVHMRFGVLSSLTVGLAALLAACGDGQDSASNTNAATTAAGPLPPVDGAQPPAGAEPAEGATPPSVVPAGPSATPGEVPAVTASVEPEGAAGGAPAGGSDPGEPAPEPVAGEGPAPAGGGTPASTDDPAGGASGAGPSPEDPEVPADEPVVETPSTGCAGSATPPDGPLVLDVAGTERSYIVSLPDGYDPSTPYPLIFAFHGLGGSAELVSSNGFYFGIEQTGGKPSIFVYPDGLDTGMGAGWANSDGQDVAFFDALLETMQQGYCVDSARVFSTGHSYGGMMTHTLACERAEVLRGIAPVAGAFFGRGGGDCSGPVAAWGAHGDPDDTVSYDSGWSAIQRVMETNGCDPESGTPVEPTESCTLYQCDAGLPVTWCIHDENHDWPGFAAESIKAFFDSF